jgi:glutamate:GABA antiporter
LSYSSSWILSATVTALLAFYYLPIFAAVIRLRYTQPEAARPFRIPGGKAGVWIVGSTGLAATTFAVLVALQRPGTVTQVSDGVYIVGMIALALVWMVPWAVFVVVRRAAWLTSARESAGPH